MVYFNIMLLQTEFTDRIKIELRWFLREQDQNSQDVLEGKTYKTYLTALLG